MMRAIKAGTSSVRVEKSGTVIGTRGGINFIPGTNVTLTVADDPTDDEVDVTIAAAGGGGGGTTWADPVPSGNAPGGADDDEFADASLAAGWTAVTPTGTATWVEAGDVLSCNFYSQAVSDWACQLRSLTPTSAPVTVETALRLWAPNENHSLAGIILADGTAATSNFLSLDVTRSEAGNFSSALRTGTITNMSGSPGASGSLSGHMDLTPVLWLYLRLKWLSSNSFQAWISPDGATWLDMYGGAKSVTLTPTHVGVCVSSFGGATTSRVATFEYLRVS